MTIISRKLLRRESGYEVWREMSRPEFDVEVISDAGDPAGAQGVADSLEDASGRIVEMDTTYTPDGAYIGTPEVAKMLCVDRGIVPEALPDHKVCSIGFCEREQKWYGWSHRAIFGFGIGDVVEKGDCCASSGWVQEYLDEHPEADLSLPVGFTAQSLDDAKRMAIAFAESVG